MTDMKILTGPADMRGWLSQFLEFAGDAAGIMPIMMRGVLDWRDGHDGFVLITFNASLRIEEAVRMARAVAEAAGVPVLFRQFGVQVQISPQRDDGWTGQHMVSDVVWGRLARAL